MSHFDLLAPENLISIALELPISSISSYCQLSRRFSNRISNNDYFWRLKFEHDYYPVNYNVNWKDFYESLIEDGFWEELHN